MLKIAPSILAANFAKLGEEVKEVEAAGAELIHIDVMDGHFVPNISFGAIALEAIRPLSTLPMDVHLMIENPDQYIEQFAKAGADYITVHVEACRHLHRTIQLIRSFGVKPGVVLNPHTPIESISHILEDVDMVLFMTVNPGFGGQKFMPSALEKLSILRDECKRQGLEIDLEVDGGINAETAPLAVKAGATVLVAGNYVFSAEDMNAKIAEIKSL